MCKDNLDYLEKVEYSKEILYDEIIEEVKYLKELITLKRLKQIEDDNDKYKFKEVFKKIKIDDKHLVNIYSKNNTLDILKKIKLNITDDKIRKSLNKFRIINYDFAYLKHDKYMYNEVNINEDVKEIFYKINANTPNKEITDFIKKYDILKYITKNIGIENIIIIKEFINSNYYQEYIDSRKEYEKELEKQLNQLVYKSQYIHIGYLKLNYEDENYEFKDEFENELKKYPGGFESLEICKKYYDDYNKGTIKKFLSDLHKKRSSDNK